MPRRIARPKRPAPRAALRLAAAACLALLSGGSFPARAQDDSNQASGQMEARLTRVDGTVYIHAHDSPDDEFVAAQADAPLEEGDMVRTGTDGSAEVALDGRSVIQVASNSDFTLASLDAEQSEFHLGIGSFVAKIQALLGGRSMEFHTTEAVAAVRGTELAVSQEEDGRPSAIGVFDEGRVSVRKPTGTEEVLLGPGQETSVLRGRDLGAARPLRDLLARRRGLALLRRRLGAIRRAWRARPFAQRAALRRRFLGQRRIKARELRNVRRDLRARVYRQLKARREQLRRARAVRRRAGQRARQAGTKARRRRRRGR